MIPVANLSNKPYAPYTIAPALSFSPTTSDIYAIPVFKQVDKEIPLKNAII